MTSIRSGLGTRAMRPSQILISWARHHAWALGLLAFLVVLLLFTDRKSVV